MSVRPASRFLHRLDNYRKAFARLDELVKIMTNSEQLSLFAPEENNINIEIAREALIKRFEFTQELSWNVLKDFLIYQGETELAGSRDTYRRALKLGVIDSDLWMNMIMDRNLSAHDYNDIKAAGISKRIINDYHPLLKQLVDTMDRRMEEIPSQDR